MMQMVCIMLLKELIFEDKLKQINYFEEDREIEERRTSYYCDVLGIKE